MYYFKANKNIEKVRDTLMWTSFWGFMGIFLLVIFLMAMLGL
jgi:hypothetical protein